MALLTYSIFIDLAILFALFAYLTYRYFTSTFGYWKARGVPFIDPIPFLGNFKDVVMVKANIGDAIANMYRQVKEPFFGMWVFRTPHLVLRDPELIKMVLVKDFNHFHDRTISCDKDIDSLTANFLFVIRNPEWKDLRAKLTPVFTSGKIKSMFFLMKEAGEELTEYIRSKSAQGGTLEAKEICAKFSTDVITSCAFGVRSNCFKQEDAAFRDIGRRMFDFRLITAIRGTSYFFAPVLVKLFRLKMFDDSVGTFLREAFWETINDRQQSKVKRNDLIDIIVDLMKDEKFDSLKFEGDAVVAQAAQFFTAGFETTSSTIAFTIYEMALNMKMQEQLRKEIKEALSQHDGLTYDAINSMKYLDKVVKETLRKYPILPFLDRRCVKDYKIPDSNVTIEKGTPVYIPLMGLHRDPEYFPDPDKYDPERFTEENIAQRPAYSYIPFGVGPHNCIGERFGLIGSKLGVIKIIENFLVEKTKDTPVPVHFDPRSFVLMSSVALDLKFTEINR